MQNKYSLRLMLFACILIMDEIIKEIKSKSCPEIRSSLIERSLMFALDEKVVYPGHGVARISCVLEKVVCGDITKFFELTFYSKEMTILVPMDSSKTVGLRRLSSRESIDDAFKILAKPLEVNSDNSSFNWNRRNKEYQCKLRSGDIYDICKIYRDLKHISSKKELSFGEKNLLSKTEFLLAEEISIVRDMQEEKTIEKLRSIFS